MSHWPNPETLRQFLDENLQDPVRQQVMDHLESLLRLPGNHPRVRLRVGRGWAKPGAPPTRRVRWREAPVKS